jgi:hypothetical protein
MILFLWMRRWDISVPAASGDPVEAVATWRSA